MALPYWGFRLKYDQRDNYRALGYPLWRPGAIEWEHCCWRLGDCRDAAGDDTLWPDLAGTFKTTSTNAGFLSFHPLFHPYNFSVMADQLVSRIIIIQGSLPNVLLHSSRFSLKVWIAFAISQIWTQYSLINHLFSSPTYLRALRANLWYVAWRRLRSGPAPRVA